MTGWIEIVIRRLLTDDEFRAGFLRDPHRAIEDIATPDAGLPHADSAALDALATPWKPGRRANPVEAADTQPDMLLAE